MKSYMRLGLLTKPVWVGLGMFLVLTILTQFLSYFWYQSARQAEMRRLNSQADATQERLQVTLNNCLSSTRTLAFLVEEHGVPADFDRVAQKLLRATPLVDAIELLHGGVITHVYPLGGNEAAIGYDILSDTVRHSGAVKARRTRDFFFAGPVKLKQGGIAVIGRQPIFIDGQFWGFAAGLIRLSTFLKASGIDAREDHDFTYQIARVHPENGSEEFFLPPKGSRSRENFATIEIPNTEWRLYVSPANPQQISTFALTFAAFGLVLSLLVGLFSAHMAAQPEKLSRLVKQRTAQLTTEKELSDSIINSLPGVFYLYDKNRRFYRWNRNFETVSGYSSAEVSEMHPLDFFQGDDKARVGEKIDAVFKNGKAEVEAQFYTKSKDKITYYFNGTVAYLNNNAYLVGMGIDITKRIRAESDIQNLNVRLQATVDRLQARNTDLQQFSYIVSHNLRSPLAKILGLAGIFNDHPEEQPMLIAKITEATQHLDDVVRDIGTIVSARNAHDKREHTSFDHELQLALKTLEDEVSQSQAVITTDFSGAPGIVTVQSYLQSIIYNLVSNAIKYRKPDLPPAIHLQTRKYEHGICLTVKDNGIGIDLVRHGEKIFGLYKRFYTGPVQGKGIGLCLVKNQAESLGGKVEVESRLNEGTTFSVYLPVNDEKRNLEQPHPFN
jgi:PAS domain S-box-containing protein